MLRTELLFGFILGLLLGVFPSADLHAKLDAKSRVVLKDISRRYKALGNWEAQFVEERVSTALGGQKSSAKGKFYFQKPDRFRYELEKPLESTAICNGKSAWHLKYPKNTKDPVYVRFFPKVGQLELERYLLFLRGIDMSQANAEVELEREFVVQATKMKDELTLILEPKNPSQLNRIEIVFLKDLLAPSLVRLTNSLGNSTEIRILDYNKVEKHAASLFEFKKPKNAKVETIQ